MCTVHESVLREMAIPCTQTFLLLSTIACVMELADIATERIANAISQHPLRSSIPSGLHLIRKVPQTVFPKLFKLWKITHLVFEKDTDAYARDRDAEATKLAKEAGVEVIIRTRRTLYDPDKIVKRNGNKLTMSMSQVQKVASTLGEPTKPLRAPTSLPDLREVDLSSIDHEIPALEPDFNTAHHTAGKEDQYKSVIGPQKRILPCTPSPRWVFLPQPP